MNNRSLICIGHAPIPGCGRILTDDERHYYSGACEDCERAWSDAIGKWRRGKPTEYAEFFDKMFDARETKQ
jgi:hypothetical protein